MKLAKSNKGPVSDKLMIKRMAGILTQEGYDEKIADVIGKLLTYMRKNYLTGAGKPVSAALYVALSELGFQPQICTGQIRTPAGKLVENTWLLLNGKVIDLAVYMPLRDPINSISGPVVLGIDLITMQPAASEYGVISDMPLIEEVSDGLSMPFMKFMNGFPLEREGLWTVVVNILPPEMNVRTIDLKERYPDVQENFVG